MSRNSSKVILVFVYLLLSFFLIASLVYFVLNKLVPNGVFASLSRMVPYHNKHPYQYIAVVSIIYSIIAFLNVLFFKKPSWKKIIFVYLGIVFSSIFIASISGGILWKIHDMQAGFFPSGIKFARDILWGASRGLRFGWLIFTLSVPYNIICLITGYFITAHSFNLYYSKENKDACFCSGLEGCPKKGHPGRKVFL